MNANETALYIEATLKFDPYGTQGVQWLRDAREVCVCVLCVRVFLVTVMRSASWWFAAPLQASAMVYKNASPPSLRVLLSSCCTCA